MTERPPAHPPVAEAVARFEAAFGRPAAGPVAVAPGRVNLIGEHTDYNEGFVLPLALDRYVVVAAGPRADGVLRVHAAAFGETREASVAALAAPGDGTWADYVFGVAWALQASGVAVHGADLAVVSTLPIGGGLSSSAAVELAALRALADLAGAAWDPAAMAQLGRRAETEYVGVRCGIMDQLAVAAGVEGGALLIDCRTLETAPVPLPPSVQVVVLESGVPRSLAESAYNERRAACERAVALLGGVDPSIQALRDVDGAALGAGRERLDEETYARAQHVVAENARPHDLRQALEAGDLTWAGRLLDDSHWSLRDLYEVSCPELDLITALARDHPACVGARMTGAGFGGAALALVRAGDEERFLADVVSAYRQRSGREGAGMVCSPVRGARLV